MLVGALQRVLQCRCAHKLKHLKTQTAMYVVGSCVACKHTTKHADLTYNSYMLGLLLYLFTTPEHVDRQETRLV